METSERRSFWISGNTRSRDQAGRTMIAVTIETAGMRCEIQCPDCTTYEEAEAYAETEFHRLTSGMVSFVRAV